MSMVEVHSLPCPGCGDRITIAATVPQSMAWQSRSQFAQDVFPELDAETRERFISGVCPPCWEEMYPEEEEYDEEEDDWTDRELWNEDPDNDPLDFPLNYESDWYVD